MLRKTSSITGNRLALNPVGSKDCRESMWSFKSAAADIRNFQSKLQRVHNLLNGIIINTQAIIIETSQCALVVKALRGALLATLFASTLGHVGSLIK